MNEYDVEIPEGNDPAEYGEATVEARTRTDDGPEAGRPATPSPSEPEMRRDGVADASV